MAAGNDGEVDRYSIASGAKVIIINYYNRIVAGYRVVTL
jgi:hypothetical protein